MEGIHNLFSSHTITGAQMQKDEVGKLCGGYRIGEKWTRSSGEKPDWADDSLLGKSALRTASIRVMIVLMMEAVHASETSVYFNETIRRYIPEDYQLHTRRRENMNFHITWMVVLGTGNRCKRVDRIHLAQDRAQWKAVVNTEIKVLAPLKAGNFLTSWATITFETALWDHDNSVVRSCRRCEDDQFWNPKMGITKWSWLIFLHVAQDWMNSEQLVSSETGARCLPHTSQRALFPWTRDVRTTWHGTGTSCCLSGLKCDFTRPSD
jgi:hypothetical protein